MIDAGQLWPIAAAWVDGIAAGLGKNSPRMHDVMTRFFLAWKFLVEEGQVNEVIKEC
jgi:hypothetical protein